MNRFTALLIAAVFTLTATFTAAADKPDYNASTVSGSTWQRAYSVHIDNPSGGVPSINFVEEKIFTIGGKVIHEHVGSLPATFDATNPQHLQLYGLLDEIYTNLREARDSAPAVVTPGL